MIARPDPEPPLLAEFHRHLHMARRDQTRLGIRPRPQEDEPTQHQTRCSSTHPNRNVTIHDATPNPFASQYACLTLDEPEADSHPVNGLGYSIKAGLP